VGNSSNVGCRVVGHVTVTEQRRSGGQGQFLQLLLDSGSSLEACVADPVLAGRLTDLQDLTGAERVMMNGRPERVAKIGTLTCWVRCARTKECAKVTFQNVPFVPTGKWNVLGVIPYLRRLSREQGVELSMGMSAVSARLPVSKSRHVYGKRCGGVDLIALDVVLWDERGQVQSVEEQGARQKKRVGWAADVQGEKPDASSASNSNNNNDNNNDNNNNNDNSNDNNNNSNNSNNNNDDSGDGVSKTRKEGRTGFQQRQLDCFRGERLLLRWHRRLGHRSLAALQVLVRSGQVGKDWTAGERKAALRMGTEDLQCVPCAEARQKKRHPKAGKESRKGQAVFDTGGPTRVPSREGHRYWTVLALPGKTEGSVTRVRTLLHKSRDETASLVLKAIDKHEKETGVTVVSTRSDRAPEFVGGEMKEGLEQRAISRFFTAPATSSGLAEGYIGTLTDIRVASLAQSGLGDRDWHWAAMYAGDVNDMMPRKGGQSLYEVREGKQPPLHKLRAFGCLAVVWRSKAERGHGGARGRKAIHLGRAQNGSGWIFRDIITGTIRISDSARFFDDVFPNRASSVVSSERKVQTEEVEQRREEVKEQGSEEAVEVEHEGLVERSEGKEQVGVDEVQVEDGGDGEGGGASVAVDAMVPGDAGGRDGQPVLRRSARKKVAKGEGGVTHAQLLESEEAAKRLRRAARKEEKQQSLEAEEERPQINNMQWWEEQRMAGEGIPKTLPEARQKGEEAPFYEAAYEEEMASQKEKGTWRQVGWVDGWTKEMSHVAGSRNVKSRKGRRWIGTRLVFEKKQLEDAKPLPSGPTYRMDEQGRKWRYKCRLVARGDQQQEGTHGDTYSPTPKMQSLLTIFSLALGLGWQVHSVDVKTAFLIPELGEDERVKVVMPQGCEAGGRRGVYELLKCIYGLKQSGHHWNVEADKMLREAGFVPTEADPCVYVLRDEVGKVQCILAVHVDDLLISGRPQVVEEVKGKVKASFQCTDDGEATWFLKIKVAWSADRRSVELSQPRYIQDLLEEAQMEGCRVERVPAEPHVVLEKPRGPMTEEEREKVKKWEAVRGKYRTVLGKLGYLATRTRPDLCFAVGQVQQHAADFRMVHARAVDRILRYLAGTKRFGLRFDLDAIWAPEGEKVQQQQVAVYTDSDFASDSSDRKSIAGYAVMMNGALLSWRSRKIAHVTRSTEESEIHALDEGAREALWFRRLGMELSLPGAECLTVFEDNKGAHSMARGKRPGDRLKHVDTKFFAVQGEVRQGKLDVRWITTVDNISDLFTKALGPMKFCLFRDRMGVKECLL
jgi:hypothetical protein